MSEMLAPYFAAAEQEAKEREEKLPLGDLEWVIADMVDPYPHFAEVLTTSPSVAVIAEHKRRSPGAGELSPDSDVTQIVEQYRQAGALALSIVTQTAHFGGNVEDLKQARSAVDLPILRKDFIRSPYQLYESKAFGADAVLLIVGGLTDSELSAIYEEADAIDLDCLIEIHDREELYRAMELNPSLIGINNRNLDTSKIDLDITRKLVEEVPKGISVVAESGYHVRRPEDMRELRALGVAAVLIGTTLMQEENPAEALIEWLRTPITG